MHPRTNMKDSHPVPDFQWQSACPDCTKAVSEKGDEYADRRNMHSRCRLLRSQRDGSGRRSAHAFAPCRRFAASPLETGEACDPGFRAGAVSSSRSFLRRSGDRRGRGASSRTEEAEQADEADQAPPSRTTAASTAGGVRRVDVRGRRRAVHRVHCCARRRRIGGRGCGRLIGCLRQGRVR